MRDVAADPARALEAALALRSRVEATGYKPLLGELLEITAGLQWGLWDVDSRKAEATSRDAFLIAETAGDDVTAARAAAGLAFVGARHGSLAEAQFWARLSDAILDRLKTEHPRIRSWTLNNYAASLSHNQDFEGARALWERSLALKRQALGNDHPDVAITASNLTSLLTELGRPAEGMGHAASAIDILTRRGDPDSPMLGRAYVDRGDALIALGKPAEAETDYRRSLEILRVDVARAHPIHGLGESRVALGKPAAALPYFEDALRIRRRDETDRLFGQMLTGDTEFALARALWDSGGDRRRAISLALAAKVRFSPLKRRERALQVQEWLATHQLKGSRPGAMM
jgi:tetratricopeptide (TPR) repeat protein